MRSILINHAHRYPEWNQNDLYKLIHQAAMGSEHALTDEIHVRDWLTREMADLGPGPEEPLIDPISPDGKIVRVHLRPFARLKLDEESLLRAFLLTAKEYPGFLENLIDYADAAIQLAREGALALDANEITKFIGKMQTAGFPAIHHSQEYEEAYQPAYRVVARDLLPAEFFTAD